MYYILAIALDAQLIQHYSSTQNFSVQSLFHALRTGETILFGPEGDSSAEALAGPGLRMECLSVNL